MSNFLVSNLPRLGSSARAALGVSLLAISSVATAAESFCPRGASPDPAVIWCDSFENEDLGPNGTILEKYYDVNSNGGELARTTAENLHGSYALRARYQAGEIDAGYLFFNFGRSPLPSQVRPTSDFREIYWRVYVKLDEGFVGHPAKYTRATSFATSNRAQAMIAHVWTDNNDARLNMDPVSGIDAQGNLATTQWNDFPNLRWLGLRWGTTTIDAGRWYCVEAHVRLNTAGSSDGVFEFWIDDNLQARRADLNWVGTWNQYGINSIMLETYWNGGSSRDQERYFDAFVVSTKRIGCVNSTRPNPPTNLSIQPQ